MRLVLVFILFAGLCSNFAYADGYDELFADGTFDVTVALGFEQLKSGIHVKRDLENTLSDVAAIEWELSTCSGSSIYKKQRMEPGLHIYAGRFFYKGRKITSRLRIIFSEPGTTISRLRAEFIDALGHDSVVIYLGHSRHGDGFPDFASPIADTGKVFKDDPVRGWLGFEKGYFSRTKYQILMLDSCLTDRYYHDVLRSRVWEKAPSELGLILSTGMTWFEDYPASTAALVSGLINQLPRAKLVEWINGSAARYNFLQEDAPKKLDAFVFDAVLDDGRAGRTPGQRVDPAEPWGGFPF